MRVVLMLLVFIFLIVPNDDREDFPRRAGRDQARYFQRWIRKRT
jgi:hypothetical protein